MTWPGYFSSCPKTDMHPKLEAFIYDLFNKNGFPWGALWGAARGVYGALSGYTRGKLKVFTIHQPNLGG